MSCEVEYCYIRISVVLPQVSIRHLPCGDLATTWKELLEMPKRQEEHSYTVAPVDNECEIRYAPESIAGLLE